MEESRALRASLWSLQEEVLQQRLDFNRQLSQLYDIQGRGLDIIEEHFLVDNPVPIVVVGEVAPVNLAGAAPIELELAPLAAGVGVALNAYLNLNQPPRVFGEVFPPVLDYPAVVARFHRPAGVTESEPALRPIILGPRPVGGPSIFGASALGRIARVGKKFISRGYCTSALVLRPPKAPWYTRLCLFLGSAICRGCVLVKGAISRMPPLVVLHNSLLFSAKLLLWMFLGNFLYSLYFRIGLLFKEAGSVYLFIGDSVSRIILAVSM